MHCSFVFPEEIPRPTPTDLILKEALKKMSKESKKQYYEDLEKAMKDKSKADIELTQLKTKITALQQSNANDNKIIKEMNQLEEKIKELEDINKRISEFERKNCKK